MSLNIFLVLMRLVVIWLVASESTNSGPRASPKRWENKLRVAIRRYCRTSCRLSLLCDTSLVLVLENKFHISFDRHLVGNKLLTVAKIDNLTLQLAELFALKDTIKKQTHTIPIEIKKKSSLQFLIYIVANDLKWNCCHIMFSLNFWLLLHNNRLTQRRRNITKRVAGGSVVVVIHCCFVPS